MKRYKEFTQELKESTMSHEYVLHSLADKDINAHIKNGKVVVHPDDVKETRKHLKKIGHDHLKVTHKGSDQVAESAELDEVLKPSMGAGEYVKDFEKSDNPKFSGKSKDKRREMAIAAYLSAKRKQK